jgi:glycine/D-amino acid oxidase-like deaminating enzyme
MAATPQIHEADALFDLVVIGGGVNGCGIARDAAGRGLAVALFEQGDLACGTSSASTKLIHGGLRYLGMGRSAWCARRWRNAKCCGAWRRTSSGRCGSSCRFIPA